MLTLGVSLLLMVAVFGGLGGWALREDARRRHADEEVLDERLVR